MILHSSYLLSRICFLFTTANMKLSRNVQRIKINVQYSIYNYPKGHILRDIYSLDISFIHIFIIPFSRQHHRSGPLSKNRSLQASHIYMFIFFINTELFTSQQNGSVWMYKTKFYEVKYRSMFKKNLIE